MSSTLLRGLLTEATEVLEDLGRDRARLRQLVNRLEEALQQAEEREAVGSRPTRPPSRAAVPEPEAERPSRVDPDLPRGPLYVVLRPRRASEGVTEGRAGIYLHYQAFARQLCEDSSQEHFYSRFKWAANTEGKKADGPDAALALWYSRHGESPPYFS
jgi:hypothetical protein